MMRRSSGRAIAFGSLAALLVVAAALAARRTPPRSGNTREDARRRDGDGPAVGPGLMPAPAPVVGPGPRETPPSPAPVTAIVRVVRDDGTPVPGAVVRIQRAVSRWETTLKTGDDGVARATVPIAGRHVISVDAGPIAPSATLLHEFPSEGEAVVRLVTGCRLVARVTTPADATGTDAHGQVTALGADGSARNAALDPTGTADLGRWAPGLVTVRVERGGDAGVATVLVPGDGTVEVPIAITLRTRSGIRLVDPGTAGPLPNWTLRFAGGSETASSDPATGVCTTTGIAPRTVVRADAPGFAPTFGLAPDGTSGAEGTVASIPADAGASLEIVPPASSPWALRLVLLDRAAVRFDYGAGAAQSGALAPGHTRVRGGEVDAIQLLDERSELPAGPVTLRLPSDATVLVEAWSAMWWSSKRVNTGHADAPVSVTLDAERSAILRVHVPAALAADSTACVFLAAETLTAPIAEAPFDANGRAVLYGVPAEVPLRVEASGSWGAASRRIRLVERESSDLEFDGRTDGTAEVSARVVDDRGEPVEGAHVCWYVSANCATWSVTDRAGTARADAPRGTIWLVLASKTGHASKERGPAANGATVVVLPRTATLRVRLRASEVATILTLSGGDPRAHAPIRAVAPRGGILEIPTLLPGPYHLTLRAVGGRTVADEDLTLAPGAVEVDLTR
jgi:hypothetical protein